MFAYFGFHRSAVQVGKAGRLLCIIFVSFLWSWWLTLFHLVTIGYYTKLLHISILHPFDRFLDISILAWNAYLVRSKASVIPQVFIWALQCDINETATFGNAWFMKSHGFLVSKKVRHMVMILSFRIWLWSRQGWLLSRKEARSPSWKYIVKMVSFSDACVSHFA